MAELTQLRPGARASCVLLWGLCGLGWGGSVAAQTTVALRSPVAVAYDAAGDLYIADAARQQVLEATVGGALQVVAGSGVQGFRGDGGAATAAELNEPSGVAVGSDGTIYIADTGNQRVRAVSPGGVIRTFAGTGVAGGGGDGGPAVQAQLDQPVGLALDATGALLIADSGNQRVRRVAAGTIVTLAGSGVQGFAGNGGSAAAAELDTPLGMAVDAAGSVWLADEHNGRIRRVDASGTVTTAAGSGAPGFSGDGGGGSAAQLDRPAAVALLPDGTVLLADSANHRVRALSASGTISTVVGTGVQGSAADGSVATAAELDSPRGLAVSPWGAVAIADPPNHAVMVLASDGTLRLPAAMAAGRSSVVALSAATTMTYGQAATASAQVSGAVGTPQGAVALQDSGSLVAAGSLAAGDAVWPLGSLSAGAHSLTATYAGDGLNPAAVSSPAAVVVAPAAVTAVAQGVSVAYGAAIPPLQGTLAGVLPQDAAAVQAVFTSAAQAGSVSGTYPIAASLTGAAAANYVVSAGAGSGAVVITPAPTTTAAQQPTQSGYAGLPLLLQARVSSGSLVPVGAVNFVEGGSVVASGTLSGGSAAVAWLQPTQGTHTLVPQYVGSTNFAPSAGAAIQVSVAAMPDFSLSGGGSQTVQLGGLASYTISVLGQGPFSGAVSLSVAGLPAGATASFAPPEVVPGSSTATSVLTVQAPAVLASMGQGSVWMWALLLPMGFMLRRRGRGGFAVAALMMLAVVVPLAGCGTRTVSEATQAAQSFTLTVTGTGTNLAGQVVAHQTTVTLRVQ